MPWNQVFPVGTSQVSQAPTLFQQNWAFINTNLNTDHFFNSITPANEGHHSQVQLLDQGPRALAAGMSGAMYANTAGNVATEQPYWVNAVGTFQIPTVITGQTAVIVGLTNLFNFVGRPRSSGFVAAHDPNNTTSRQVTFYWWNGANVIVGGNFGGNALVSPSFPVAPVALDLFTGGNGLGFAGVGSILTITSNYAGTTTYQIFAMPY